MNKRCAIKERNSFFFLSYSFVDFPLRWKEFFRRRRKRVMGKRKEKKIGQSLGRLITTRSSVYAPYLFHFLPSAPVPSSTQPSPYKIHKKDDSRIFFTLRRSRSWLEASPPFEATTLRNSKMDPSNSKLFLNYF